MIVLAASWVLPLQEVEFILFEDCMVLAIVEGHVEHFQSSNS